MSKTIFEPWLVIGARCHVATYPAGYEPDMLQAPVRYMGARIHAFPGKGKVTIACDDGTYSTCSPRAIRKGEAPK